MARRTTSWSRPAECGCRSVTSPLAVIRATPASRLVALVAAVALTGVACMAARAPAPTATPIADDGIPRGGTLRVVVPRSQLAASLLLAAPPEPGSTEPDPRLSVLDPHVDAWYDSAELLRCCLARTLLSTNGLSTEDGGAILRPDLAAAMPEISADGLAWTFTVRDGVRYGPPLGDVEVTAADFVRGFHRLLSPELRSFGQFIFSDIVGAEAYIAGDATTIAGLEANDQTLVVRLTSPSGDLGARLALAMAAPVPPLPTDPSAPFGVAAGHTLPRPEDEGPPSIGVYGRFLVSTGPYMLAGSEALDFSLPAADQAPVAGVVPGESITLVRNPRWDATTDSLRPARPDRLEIRVVTSVEEAVAELDAGRADVVMNPTQAPTIPPAVVAEFQADPGRGTVHIDRFDGIRGLEMNIAQPPFDDIHVRKAANLVLDKSRIIELHGGPFAFRVAEHMTPDSVLNNLLLHYAPYGTPGGRGNLEAAKAEMRQSRYDTDGDGICDHEACTDVPAVTREPYGEIAEVVSDSFASLGIELALDTLDGHAFFEEFYPDPTRHVGVYVPLGWATSTTAPFEFFARYYGPLSAGQGSLVGASEEQLAEWGYEPSAAMSVDDHIEACIPLAGTERFECWASVDQHIMENVVPLVPYGNELFVVLTSPRVVHYAFDQSVDAPALDHIGLAPDG